MGRFRFVLTKVSILCLAAFLLVAPPVMRGQGEEKGAETEPTDFSKKIIPPGIVQLRDVPYASDGNPLHRLDLYLPSDYQTRRDSLPVIFILHGGGWFTGDKDQDHYMFHGMRWAFLRAGYAICSANYRLSGEAPFPAAIQDGKAALRWLRVHAADYRIDADRVGLWGGSAGGNLVALFGTSAGEPAFEVGEYREESTRVRAVCDFCGKTDLATLIADNPERDKIPLAKEIDQYIGGPIAENREIAVAASPITYVTADDPPFLIVHGDADPVNDYRHAVVFYEKLKAAGVPVTLVTLPETPHDGPAFVSEETRRTVIEFFDLYLKK